MIGVRGGDGVIFLRDHATGAWSAPAFVASAEGSFGFQIGGQAIDAIMLIMNRDGVDMLLKSRFKVGVDASAAAGPVGRDASAKVGPGTAILAYSRAKGLYAGVAFEGGALLNHDEFNRALYGMDVGLREILFNGAVAVPPEAYPMIETLQSYSNTATVQSTPITIQSPATATVAATAPVTVAPAPAPVAAPATLSAPAAGVAAPPLPEPTPDSYVGVQPPAPIRSPDQQALDAAAVDAAQAATAAQEAARAAQEAAAAAAARAAEARQR